MRRLLAAMLTLLVLFSLAACGAPPTPEEPVPPVQEELPAVEPPPPATEPEPPADPVEELLTSMTLEEKVGQLFFVRCPAENAAEDVSAYHLGGYILFGRDTKDKTADALIQTIQSYQDAAAVPLLIGVDEEGGTVVRVSSNPHLRASKFQSPQKLFAGGGMEAVTADAREKDILLDALGFNVNLAPVADVSTDPGDFIYNRAFGRDAAATADYVSAVTAQMAADGMGSVLKHFPGYGNNADTHVGIAIENRSLEELEAQDLLPFAAGMEAGCGAVMMSHIQVTALDAEYPASLSPAVHRYVRETMGYNGVLVTDDLVMDAISVPYGVGEAAVLAVLAGNDLLISSDFPEQYAAVLEAIREGRISEEQIDNAVRRVLLWKQSLGLLSGI